MIRWSVRRPMGRIREETDTSTTVQVKSTDKNLIRSILKSYPSILVDTYTNFLNIEIKLLLFLYCIRSTGMY